MKLREKRLACNLKQEELAERIGTNVPLLSNFERYICLPIPKMLDAICKEMNCEILDIYEPKEIYLNQLHNHTIKTDAKELPSVYKLTVELPNNLREMLSSKNLEKCGYHSLKDFIWHCCKRFEKQLAIIQEKEKPTQLVTAKVVENGNAIAHITHQ